MAKELPSKISFSTETWVKIIIFLFVHGGIILAAAWAFTQQTEHRLTILETNQVMFMKIVEEHHLGKKK